MVSFKIFLPIHWLMEVSNPGDGPKIIINHPHHVETTMVTWGSPTTETLWIAGSSLVFHGEIAWLARSCLASRATPKCSGWPAASCEAGRDDLMP
jgi:hypothetical protein